MSIKKLSNLLDSNPIQSKSSKKTNIEPENSIESDPLKPEKTREFELYSNDVIKSKHSKYKSYPEDQFTNFLNEDVVQNFVNNINLFWPDLKKLNDHGMDETDYFSLPETAQLRLERIFKLYLTREFSLTNINKIKLRTNELDKSTSFRIFVILEGDKYLVFLLDPLHLVVTDKRTREKKVFKNNKGNGTCMSKYLK
ncbi:hypothetical protein [Streptococcus sp.]|jgi:hypothetical protein